MRRVLSLYTSGAVWQRMTVPERVEQFVRENRPARYCDDCLADRLKLRRRQQAQQATATLGAVPSFLRESGTCSVCLKTAKLVIRAA